MRTGTRKIFLPERLNEPHPRGNPAPYPSPKGEGYAPGMFSDRQKSLMGEGIGAVFSVSAVFPTAQVEIFLSLDFDAPLVLSIQSLPGAFGVSEQE